MESLDKPFDPNFHQVIQQVSDPTKPVGTIIAELQTGYMFGEEGKMYQTETWIDIDTGAAGGGAPMLLRLEDLKAFYAGED